MLRILIAEDEPLLAIDLEIAARDRGHLPQVLMTLDSARTAAAQGLDGAIINYILQGEKADPLIDDLTTRKVAFLIVSGVPHIVALPREARAHIVGKPASAARVVRMLEEMVRVHKHMAPAC
jgi:hypothetical protein